MDSKKRTQILYDDPNSMFKSAKKIYLHELQGATLRTSKPFPEDINVGLKAADLLSSLIGNLQQIDDIAKYFLDGMDDINFYRVYNLVSTRTSNKLVNECLVLIKKMMKISMKSFNEDDVFNLFSIFRDIKETFEFITTNVEFMNTPYYGERDFINYLRSIEKLLQSLDQFILFLGESTGSQITRQNQPLAPQIQQDEPIDLPPAPELEGAGRFKVLSKRISKRQPYNFKRFL
jgi:hypothetical protein